MNGDWLDVVDHPPTDVGWYATVQCWEASEGLFPGATYWDGAQWSRERGLVQRSPQTFATAAFAEQWARAHDPEGLT